MDKPQIRYEYQFVPFCGEAIDCESYEETCEIREYNRCHNPGEIMEFTFVDGNCHQAQFISEDS